MKRILTLMLAAAMIFALAACTESKPQEGSGATEAPLPENTAETPAEGKDAVVIRFYNEPTEEGPALDPERYPEAHVEYTEVRPEAGSPEAERLTAAVGAIKEWVDNNIIDRMGYTFAGVFEIENDENTYYFTETGELFRRGPEGDFIGMLTAGDAAFLMSLRPEAAPTAAPDPDVFVPEGYDAHDYLALAEFLSAPLGEGGYTIGENCYSDYFTGEFDVMDPSTWRTDYHGVKWDPETGKALEITLHPSVDHFPVELRLSGFEKLEKVAFWDVTFDSIVISDCPALTDGCMIYTGSAAGDVVIEAGYVTQLNAGSDTHVHCSLMGDKYPFELDLSAEGPGRVSASAVYYEGEYTVSCTAIADEYVDFLGWYDNDGKLASAEISMQLSGGEMGFISGSHVYTARFAKPAAPTPLPGGDFFCEITPNVETKVDIDGDGESDTVLVSVGSGEEEEGDLISMTVTLAAKPEEPYYFPVDNMGGEVCAAAVDFDPTDTHIEIVATYDECDGDQITCVWRLKDDGSGFDEFTECVGVVFEGMEGTSPWYFGDVPEGWTFSAAEGLSIDRRTEILGTTFVINRITVTENGIEYLDNEYRYPGGEYELTLKRELKVTLENGKTKTLPVGARIKPYSTDRRTFVKVLLEDGGIGTVKVTFGNTDYDYPVLLNGVDQDEYADIQYAD